MNTNRAANHLSLSLAARGAGSYSRGAYVLAVAADLLDGHDFWSASQAIYRAVVELHMDLVHVASLTALLGDDARLEGEAAYQALAKACLAA